MHSQKQFSSTLRVPVRMCMQRRLCLRMLCESRCVCVRTHCIYAYHAVSLGKVLKTSLLDCCLPIFQCRTGHSNICRSPTVCAWVVISRAFFLFFPCNHIINIKKNSFSGEVIDSVTFPFCFLLHKLHKPMSPPCPLSPPTPPPIPTERFKLICRRRRRISLKCVKHPPPRAL